MGEFAHEPGRKSNDRGFGRYAAGGASGLSVVRGSWLNRCGYLAAAIVPACPGEKHDLRENL